MNKYRNLDISIKKNVDTTNLIKQNITYSVMLNNISKKFRISGNTHVTCNLECYSDSVLDSDLVLDNFKRYIPRAAFITNLPESELDGFEPEVFIVEDIFDLALLTENFKELILTEILSDENIQELDFIWTELHVMLDIINYDEN